MAVEAQGESSRRVSFAAALSVLGIGIAAFVATNIDDIFLLSAFFADHRLRARSVVLGQFLGIGAIVAASWICALVALAIPQGWIATLGVIPLALGVKDLRSSWRRASDLEEDARIHEQELAAEQRTHSQVMAVALVTVANSGDNLGVYIPLFASQPAIIPIYAVLFAILTGVWCILGHLLVNNPLIGQAVRKYGHLAMPYVLIGLGIFILADARTLLG
jgi:cadmium resistance protein CadD (predicted permease)